MRSWNSVAFIDASLEKLPVRAELGQSCLATKISAPGPNIFGGSATLPLLALLFSEADLLQNPASVRSKAQPDL